MICYGKQYARKHNPFISYANVQNNPSRCAQIVNGGEFLKDVAAHNLPNYSFYVPDLNNDGHDTGVAFADRWFAKTFSPLLQDAQLMQDLLIIATFDEGVGSNNHIYTALVGNMVRPGSVITAPHDQFSFLRLIEDGLGLGSLGRNDRSAAKIEGIWK